MKAIGQKLLQAEAFPSWSLLAPLSYSWNIIRNIWMPTHLTIRKQQNMVKGWIKGMDFRYVLQRSFFAIQNNVSAVWKIFFCAWNHCSNFSWYSWEIVSTMICARKILKSNLALMLRRHVLCQLQCLFVQSDSMVMAMKHVLEITHNSSVQSGIELIVHTKVESFIWIIDIELGEDRRLIERGKKWSNAIGKRAMDFEDEWTTSIILQKLSANRSHCEYIVVLSDIGAKFLCSSVLADQQIV